MTIQPLSFKQGARNLYHLKACKIVHSTNTQEQKKILIIDMNESLKDKPFFFFFFFFFLPPTSKRLLQCMMGENRKFPFVVVKELFTPSVDR